MTKKQLEIDNLIKGNGLIYSYVARNIGVSRQTLNNQLNHTVEIKMEYYIDIKNFVNDILNNSIVKKKEVEYGGMTLIEQIEVLKEQCSIYKKELRSLISQLKQLEKNCGDKEDCLIKNMKIENHIVD